MNVVIRNNKKYKYESYWLKNKEKVIYDSNDLPFPYPVENKDKWTEQDNFLDKLKDVHMSLIDDGYFYRYDRKHYADCLLCDKKNVTTGKFEFNNIIWEDGLKHYINKHNIKPSKEFIEFIFRYNTTKKPKERIIARINGRNIVRDDKRYMKIDKNQILIMDALMRHGRYKIYADQKDKKTFRYSEHAGLLDFTHRGLEKIVVFGNTTRVDEIDNDIYMPKSVSDIYEYEYIFHTHPPTPKPGSRVEVGILYEFPSISDMFHFIDHHNEGKIQGSIIIAPEGMYIIRKKEQDNKKIKIDEDKFYKQTAKKFNELQDISIAKYGSNFSTYEFFSKIAQDKEYINGLNQVLNRFEMHVDYYPRIKDQKNRWIIDSIYLPVYVQVVQDD